MIPTSDEFIDRQTKEKNTLNILRYPCRTQAVEPLIKSVTETSSSGYDKENRDGFIRAELSSRTKT